jgi:TolB-like protein
VRCAIEVQNAMIERNAGVPEDRGIVFRIGIHLGDVVEEADGDLMGDGVNIAARLEGIARPGAICLSEDAYRQVSGRLDMEVADLGPTQLKNIERPIRVYSLQVGVPAQAKPRKPPAPTRKRSILLVAGIAALLILIAGGAWWFFDAGRFRPTQAAHLSLVVLPFSNLSGDPAQDYFADGVTENLTTELSRIRDSFVIARNTAFTYKGKSVDAKQIGKELGVRYVLEGSVQRDQNRVRVNAQLIDAESGAHLWADRFEDDVADLFKLQDQVVARLANALGYELVVAEAKMGSRSPIPDAVDLGMRGWTLIWRNIQQPLKERRESVNDARALFDRAPQIDPNDADALAGSAYAYYISRMFAWGDPGTDYEAKVLGQADRAIVLAPEQRPSISRKIGLSDQFTAAPRRTGRRRGRPRHQPEFRDALDITHRRRKFSGPIRAGQGRRSARHAAKSARPPPKHTPRRNWRCGTQPWPLERGHRPISPSDRLGISLVLRLHELGRRLRTGGQNGRSEDHIDRGSSPQSQTHGQMDDGTYAESAGRVRWRPKSRAAGAVIAARNWPRRHSPQQPSDRSFASLVYCVCRESRKDSYGT